MTIFRRAPCAVSFTASLHCQAALATSFVGGAALALSAVVFVPVAESEQLPTVAEAIAQVRPVTSQDAAVHTMLLRGHLPLGKGSFGFRYSYEAPNHYVGLSSVGLSSIGLSAAPYFAAVNDHAFLYDPIESIVSAFSDVIPSIRLTQVNHSMQISYDLNWGGIGPPDKLAEGVLIDVPSLLHDSDVNIREIQPIEEGKYRLVGAVTLRGTPTAVTIVATRGFVTELQMGVEEGDLFVQMRVNEKPLADPVIPTMREMQKWFPVKERLPPGDMPTPARLTLPLAALFPPMRQGFEFASGTKPDWTAVEANMKRDAVNLRKALPKVLECGVSVVCR
jgi:hypothetical protein